MPFTREPLDYPVIRVFLRVGIRYQILRATLPPVPYPERREAERCLRASLGIDQGVADGLLLRALFRWRSSGELQELRLIPHPDVRRTPGLPMLKAIFFSPWPFPPPISLLSKVEGGSRNAMAKKNLPAPLPVGVGADRKVLKPIAIDWSLPPEEHVLPCRDSRQARDLGWKAVEVRAVNQTLAQYDSIPLICNPQECPRASICPTAAYNYPWQGLRCPLETVEAYRQFVNYVRELDISPHHHTDLSMVADLVRIDLQLKRIDNALQHGMMNEQIFGVAQKTGSAVTGKGAHQLLTYQSRFRKDRNDLYKELLASRGARAEMELKKGVQERSVMSVLSRLHEQFSQPKTATVVTIDTPGRQTALPAPYDPDDEDDPDLTFE